LLRQTFNKQQVGKFVLVTDADGKVLGGIALVLQGKTVRYFKGAADPAIRNLPVLHLAIWESILWSKENGFSHFDLWGYNHFVDESDQVYFINRFKKGFGGTFTFYPKKMYFLFKPLQYQLLKLAKKIYQKIK
jgi:lipid II:glycine glycyltransferase (peptidoglycan interpeptide bridge formation enzyme)